MNPRRRARLRQRRHAMAWVGKCITSDPYRQSLWAKIIKIGPIITGSPPRYLRAYRQGVRP